MLPFVFHSLPVWGEAELESLAFIAWGQREVGLLDELFASLNQTPLRILWGIFRIVRLGWGQHWIAYKNWIFLSRNAFRYHPPAHFKLHNGVHLGLMVGGSVDMAQISLVWVVAVLVCLVTDYEFRLKIETAWIEITLERDSDVQNSGYSGLNRDSRENSVRSQSQCL